MAANGVAFAKFGARFLVRAGRGEMKAGALRQRHVVIEFKDYATALACHESGNIVAPRRCATRRAKPTSSSSKAMTGRSRAERRGDRKMGDMRLVVTGAAGRMGRMLVRAIHETPGVILSGALEREGSTALGEDAGLLAGCGKAGVAVSSDPLAAVLTADGILDFSTPAASVDFAALAAQARIAL